MSTRSTPVAIDAVPGLSVCSEFFSPAVESSLYNDPLLFDYSPSGVPGIVQKQQATHGKKLNRIMNPMPGFQMPHFLPNKLLTKVCNGIAESGLCPEFIAPNYCLPISYPVNGQFFYHYDSRYRWGETVVGICLGTGGVMCFQPQTKKARGNGPPFVGKRVLNQDGLAVEIRKSKSKQGQESFVVDVHLPPRSVYVMAGDTRTEWKHMVKTNNAANRALAVGVKTNPAFWDCVVRRTITLRCTKAFSDEVLARLLRFNPSDAVVKARVKAQSKWRPQHDYGEGDLTDDKLRNLRLSASQECNAVHASFSSSLFLSASERGYVPKHPGKSCWPLKGLVGAHQPSSLVEDMSSSSQKPRASNSNSNMATAASRGGGMVASSSRLSSSSPSQGAAAPALSKEELRARRCLFYASGGAAAASAADSAATSIVGGHDNKKKQNRKKPPPAAAGSGAAATAAIDLSGDGSSDDDENSKPPAKKKVKKNASSIEIIEID